MCPRAGKFLLKPTITISGGEITSQFSESNKNYKITGKVNSAGKFVKTLLLGLDHIEAFRVSPFARVMGQLNSTVGVIKLKSGNNNWICEGIIRLTKVSSDTPKIAIKSDDTISTQPDVEPHATALTVKAAKKAEAIAERKRNEEERQLAAQKSNFADDTSAPLIALPPTLETSTAIIEITGGIVDASAIVDVRVGGRSVPLTADGTFSIRRGVPVGESELVVSALDEWGNESEKRVRITRLAPKEAPVEDGRDRDGPKLKLPQELVTEAPEIDIAGSVSDASAIADMLVNERPLKLRADGSFRISQRLKVSINEFAFTAIDEWGNRASETIRVLRKQLDLALGDYHALVIGNNDYGDMPKLKTAVADAEAVSEVLRDRYGFSVTTLINATRFDMIGAMGELRAKLSYDTNLLVYYAGHGIVDPVTERGYWLPVDAHQNNSANWVSNDDITDMLKAISARHILVIADSCYSGTLVRAAPIDLDTWEDRRDWLKRIVEKRSRTALASGGLEPVADSGSDGHSVFARALLSALRENSKIVEAQALFAPARKTVVLNTDQTPVYSDIRMAGHDGGDFIFAPK